MSLDFTKYRKASHAHIAVAGSYTDTFIEAQGSSPSSLSTDAFVRWVPNNKDSWTDSNIETGTVVNELEELGYLEWQPGSVGYHTLYFKYYSAENYAYDGSSTSPGIALVNISSFVSSEEGCNQMAAHLGEFIGNPVDDGGFIVIINNRAIGSSSDLHTQMLAARSWRHEVTLGSTTAIRNWTYAACMTNINDIGFLSEALSGYGTHSNASIELAIEHNKANIGHAGYGKDMASGLGNGADYIGMETGTYASSINTLGNGTAHQYWKVSGDEWVRATWESKIGQGAQYWGGAARLRMYYLNGGGGTTTTVNNPVAEQQSTDVWTKNELIIKKPNSTDQLLKLSLEMDQGSGIGNGYDSHNTLDIRNLEVYKCGQGPDQERDISVHKWHINALNVDEGPGNFKIGKESSFKTFHASDRNLLGNSTTYTLDTAYGNTLECKSRQYTNTSVGNAYNQSRYNYPRFQADNYTSTSDSQTWGWTRDVWSASANHASTKFLGTGTVVDHTKMYMSGIWVRVRENNHTNYNLAPNRISLCATAKTAGGQNTVLGGETTPGAFTTNHAFQSVYAGQYGMTVERQEWKLITGFYLPSWFTSGDMTTWIEDYWAAWSQYEWDEEQKQSGNVPGYGIENLVMSKVAVMSSSVATIRSKVVCEQYSDTDLWAEFMYPFLIEIDPANFVDGGNAHFWDFTES